MSKALDLIGQRFGRLVVVSRASNNQRKQATWRCLCDCGIEKFVSSGNLRSGDTKSCGCLRKDILVSRVKNRNPNWRGGRIVDTFGYVHVIDSDHPNADKRGYVREHVREMSKYLGRPLKKNETIHHKNGIRDDNRLENLELFTSHHPPGQRVVDLISWARDILSDYGPRPSAQARAVMNTE